MKLISALLVFATAAFAQEIQQVSAEQAGKIARMVTAALGSPTDAPFAVDADASGIADEETEVPRLVSSLKSENVGKGSIGLPETMRFSSPVPENTRPVITSQRTEFVPMTET